MRTAAPGEHDTPPSRTPRARLRHQTAHEIRRRRRRLIAYGLFAGSVVLVVNALVGENGYLATIRAEMEYTAVEGELHRVRLENQALLDEIHRLNTDPAALEEAARRDLGLIKPGETVIILKDRTTPDDPGR